MTMDEYFRATPDKRATIDALKPPTAHTHRGKPRAWEMDGYHEATREKRTPTHRGEPRAENIPPGVRMIQAHADRAERNLNG